MIPKMKKSIDKIKPGDLFLNFNGYSSFLIVALKKEGNSTKVEYWNLNFQRFCSVDLFDDDAIVADYFL